MKIIYDATKAEQEKLRLDTEIPEKNRKYARNNRIGSILLALCVLCLEIDIILVSYYVTKALGIENDRVLFAEWCLCCAFVSLLVIGGAFALYFVNKDIILPAEDYYSPAIKYHTTTQGKKILDIKTLGSPPWKLYLNVEDENHVVTKEEINLHFPNKVRTDISEIIIDMNEQVVYTPYEKEVGDDDTEVRIVAQE